MKAKIIFFIIALIACFADTYAQRDTVIYNQDKEEYEISYWAKSAGIDTFTTVIFIPSNKVVPIIHSRITKSGATYSYNYKIKNAENTKMPLEQFLLEIDSIVTYNNKSVNDWRFGIEHRIQGCMWFPYDDLQKNETKDGFCIESISLPGIGNSYFQGRTPFYSMSEEESSSFFEEVLKNLMSFPRNYVLRKTIVPVYFSTDISNNDFLDTLISYNNNFRTLNWITTQSIADKYNNNLSNAKSALQQNKFVLVRCYLQDVLTDVDIDSSSTITSEAYALLRYNTEYLLSKLAQPSGMIVRLVNSNNEILAGSTLQYYEGSWKNAVDNLDGTFLVNTNLSAVSLRMAYAYGSQTLSNIQVGSNIVTFKTVNTQVKLQDSQGDLIDQGAVQYYSGAWRDFGTTTNGVATKELLPNNYSFRMSYAFASNDKQQNIGTDPTIIFQTVNATVQLKNSLGNFIDQGTVQYYSGAWREFGVTTDGVTTKELLPNNYSFRMSYAFASNDKQQNIGTDPTVVFQTVNATVQLKNSLGNLMPAPTGDAGTVQYYSGAWRSLGTTSNGIVTKELLPNNYSFRMSYAFASNDKQQNIGTNPTVVFQTVNTIVQLKNSLGNFIDQGTVQYYSGAWREFGTTATGVATKELLPNNYSFRMTHEFISNDKAQNIGINNIVEFNTVLCNVNVIDAQNQIVNNAVVSYYSGAWRSLGTTLNGTAVKELLPANLTFRAVSGSKQADKTQNILTNNIVEIKLP